MSCGGDAMVLVANLVLSALWLWIFNQLGWITFTSHQMPLWEVVALSALVTWAVTTLLMKGYGLVTVMTCGLALFGLPVIMLAGGWFIIILTAKLTHWFTVNVGFWGWGFLMSAWFSWVRIPTITVSSSTSTSSSSS